MPGISPFRNEDVVSKLRTGVPEAAVVKAIQTKPVDFDVSAQGIIALHAAGVTEAVLNEMIRREHAAEAAGFWRRRRVISGERCRSVKRPVTVHGSRLKK